MDPTRVLPEEQKRQARVRTCVGPLIDELNFEPRKINPQVALQEGHPKKAEGDGVAHRGEEGGKRIRHSVLWETQAAAGASRTTAAARRGRGRGHRAGAGG